MEELLNLILNEVKGIKVDISDLKEDVSGIKEDVSSLKAGQARLESQVKVIDTKLDNLTSEVRSNFKYKNNDWMSIGRHLKILQANCRMQR